MKTLDQLIRPNIQKLKPYSSARDEYKGTDGVFLDANENPFGELNRYPDPYQKKLKSKLAELKSVSTDSIFVGNGSDEVIDLAFRIFCEPGKDKALTFSPTYGMYEVSAAINDVELIKVPFNSEFQIDFDLTKPFLSDPSIKLIFVCSPNNPTGNSISGIEEILKSFGGIVIIDEAYIDFSEKESWLKRLNEFPNLIISQTFSKAWGLAAARVGLAFASAEIINWFNKVKPPYNVSELNQQAALKALEKKGETFKKINLIKSEKIELERNLDSLEIVKKVYPSDGNFLLVEVSDADKIYAHLTEQKIVVRNRNSVVRNCLRITVGSAEENKKMLNALQNYKS
ncbi:MAG: histidinol-phosphate transaminase [Crocinitomicaceae bacterium]|nr:histidinol-phosphate transaminase [Crocinitomicaceae bacterium]